MPWKPNKKKDQEAPLSDNSDSLSSTESPIKVEEVEEEELETYIVPARKLSLEEAKLAWVELEKQKKSVVAANKKVIRQLEGFFLDSVSGHKDGSLPFRFF